MKPDVVVDIGNTRTKLGTADLAMFTSVVHGPDRWAEVSPPPDPSRLWAVASVNPPVRDQFVEWVRGRGERVWVFDHWTQAGIPVEVDFPEKVGADRLMNAVAARQKVAPGTPAVLVDAGTAVTVDLLDEKGAFAGGAIMPGIMLMLVSLTLRGQQLPDLGPLNIVFAPPQPAKNTEEAMKAGAFWAAVGGIVTLVREFAAKLAHPPEVFLTGGDRVVLITPVADRLPDLKVHFAPELTLEGIRIAAEALP
ncbi:MAG: type III pantothenate kinase [Planctomycetia bacterium]|nr:type III pantothenate kinase [Planctomycetia bacterium]